MCRFGHCSVSSALEGQRLSIDVRLDSTGGPGVNAGYVSEAVSPSDVLLERLRPTGRSSVMVSMSSSTVVQGICRTLHMCRQRKETDTRRALPE